MQVGLTATILEPVLSACHGGIWYEDEVRRTVSWQAPFNSATTGSAGRSGVVQIAGTGWR